MLVVEKMTAIADKIRVLLGLTGTMGVDAMANNLGTALTELENAYTAVGNKNGTIPAEKTIGNLSSAIGTVSTGVAVQKKSGSARTSSKGSFTVDCGFKPDFVFLHHNEKDADDGCLYSAAVSFTEETRTGASGKSPYLAMWSNSCIYSIYVSQTDSGFYLEAWKYDDDWNSSDASNTTFNYVAVKYT